MQDDTTARWRDNLPGSVELAWIEPGRDLSKLDGIDRRDVVSDRIAGHWSTAMRVTICSGAGVS